MSRGIVYRVGNALEPELSSPGARAVIPHVCNNKGAWGRGFVLAVSAVYPEAEASYRRMREPGESDIALGRVGFPRVAPGVTIANMIAQDGFPSAKRRVALDYDALTDCLYQVAAFCDEAGAEVHAPKFGAGIAGGDWQRIEAIINQTLIVNRIPVIVYEFKPGKP